MLSKSNLKSRRGSSYKISFPTIPSIQKTPTYAELVQKQNTHDILVLRFSITSDMWFENLKTGVPIEFKWTQNHLEKTWYGYVSFISKVVVSAKIRTMEVYCVGASFVLKEAVTRVFSNVTVTDVVRSLAEEFGLNFIGENHPRKFEQLVVAGHSYWEWINEFAGKIGYGVYADGTNLIFRPFDKLIDQTVQEAPVFSFSDPLAQSSYDSLTKTLDEFKVLNGELIEDELIYRSEKIVSGVNPITGEIVQASSNPKTLGTPLRKNVSDVYFSEYRSDQVAYSVQDSLSASEGYASLTRFNLPAYLKGKGDPRVRPYTVIYVKNTGDLTDGYWIVKEVTHTFVRNGLYTVDIMAITDGTGVNYENQFRQANPDIIGIVNTEDILSLDAIALKSDTTVLQTPSNLVSQSMQGFERTPYRWVTTLKRI